MSTFRNASQRLLSQKSFRKRACTFCVDYLPTFPHDDVREHHYHSRYFDRRSWNSEGVLIKSVPLLRKFSRPLRNCCGISSGRREKKKKKKENEKGKKSSASSRWKDIYIWTLPQRERSKYLRTRGERTTKFPSILRAEVSHPPRRKNRRELLGTMRFATDCQ